MSPEVRITPALRTEQKRKELGLPEGLNRKQRRTIESRMRRETKTEEITISDIHYLEPVEALFNKDDIDVCSKELCEYERAQKSAKLSRSEYLLWRDLEIPDDLIRKYYEAVNDCNVPQGALTSLWLNVNPYKYKQFTARRNRLSKETERLVKINAGTEIVDEETREVIGALINCKDIKIVDIFNEIIRSQEVRIELIKMQIDWLKLQQLAKITPSENLTTEVLSEEPKENNPEFSLFGWRLFWTKNHWSYDDNHLLPIPTKTRDEALEYLTDISRGEISVKPSSVLNALEFHLRKDVIQKAMATRNKYARQETQNWVKIKRGKDRIFLLPFEEQNKAIFFVSGRDVAYRDL